MVKTKQKTRKAAEKDRLNQIYFDDVLPAVLERDPWCMRCQERRSEVGHHRKGRVGSQGGDLVLFLGDLGVSSDRIEDLMETVKDKSCIPLTIYTPLVMGLCNDCHAYVHKNPEESYERGWMIRRNSGELPEGWQLLDPFLNPGVAA